MLWIQKPNNYNTTLDSFANVECNPKLIQMWEEVLSNIFFTHAILQIHNAKSWHDFHIKEFTKQFNTQRCGSFWTCNLH